MKTVGEWREWGQARINKHDKRGGQQDKHGGHDKRGKLEILRDVEILLAEASGLSTAALIADREKLLPSKSADVFADWITRRANGEPIAYLIGCKEFWSIRLRVNRAVLIPRTESELLVEEVLRYVADGHGNGNGNGNGSGSGAHAKILELGTGSGAIALALARELPQCTITACDNCAAALAVAAENGRAHKIDNVAKNIEWILSDWFGAFSAKNVARHDARHVARHFDVIVANPPYIAPNDPHLTRGDLRFEPQAALVSKPDGLGDLTQIIASAPAHLNAHGILVVEHGYEQGDAVRELFAQHGFHAVQTCRDLAGHERVTGGHI